MLKRSQLFLTRRQFNPRYIQHRMIKNCFNFHYKVITYLASALIIGTAVKLLLQIKIRLHGKFPHDLET